MHVVLLSEGNTDVRVGLFAEARGAIAVLLQRLLAASLNAPESAVRVEGQRLPRLQSGGGYERKMRLAIELYDGKADGLAVVVDRDGNENRDRLRLLEVGRQSATASLSQRTAIGVAIEMMEAWLLADTGALATILNATGAQPDPETIPNPKAVMCTLAESAGKKPASCYDELAANCNIQVVRNRCRAFEEFAREVRQRIAHVSV